MQPKMKRVSNFLPTDREETMLPGDVWRDKWFYNPLACALPVEPEEELPK